MKISTPKELGAFIRDQRRQRGWTQHQLCAASNTQQSWLSGVEKGKGNPEFVKIMAVLRALDVTLDLHDQRDRQSTRTPAHRASHRTTPHLSALRQRFQKDGQKQ